MGRQSINAGHGSNIGYGRIGRPLTDRMRCGDSPVGGSPVIDDICEGWEVIVKPDANSQPQFVQMAKNIARYNSAKDGYNPDGEAIKKMEKDLDRVFLDIKLQLGERYDGSLWEGLHEQYKGV